MASALMSKFAGASLRAAVPTQGRVSLPILHGRLASVQHCLASNPAANATCACCIAGHTLPVSLLQGNKQITKAVEFYGPGEL